MSRTKSVIVVFVASVLPAGGVRAPATVSSRFAVLRPFSRMASALGAGRCVGGGPSSGKSVKALDLEGAPAHVTVNLEGPEYKELSALSDKHRVSLAWLGREAIIEFLERYEKEELQLTLTLSPERRRAES